MLYDIVIIGAGAAGMTAALYARRNNKTVMILEGEQFGGQIANSPKVENYPSIKAISGSELANNMFEQIISHGVEFDFGDVKSVEKKDNIFVVTTDASSYEGKTVIIANGVKHKHTGVANEESLVGKGVYYCALCDGPFYEGKEVALIGDANTALQYALLLSGYCKKVHVYTIMHKYFADKALVEALEKKENIEVTMGYILTDLIADEEGKLKTLAFKKFKEEYEGVEEFTVDYPALFVAIGQVPDNKRFENLVELNKQGYIVADESCTTKTPGVFVAGDTRTKAVRQVATATCDGAIAATAACLYIDQMEV